MRESSQHPARAMVADIGGTNARFAVADLGTLALSEIKHFPCVGHPSLAAAMGEYLGGLADPPRHAAIAVAAPVTAEEISLTNSSWSFTKTELCREAGLERLIVLNDFEALALSLPHLRATELHQIGGEAPAAEATKIVLGPGTGLGVAGLVPADGGFIATPGEGGHVSLGAHDARELDIIERLRKGREHLSVERALSGPGLVELHQAIAASHGDPLEELSPGDVASRAAGGEATAHEALGLFVTWLGRFAGDAALLLGARGGVYLGGGIAPKILPALTQGTFRQVFEAKGRMSAYLAPIPIYVILAEFAALTGAAAGLRAT